MNLNENEKSLLREYYRANKHFMLAMGLIPSSMLFIIFFSVLTFKSSWVLVITPVIFIPFAFQFKAKALYVEFLKTLAKNHNLNECEGKFYDQEGYSYHFFINQDDKIVRKKEKIDIID